MSTLFAVIFAILILLFGLSIIYVFTVRTVWSVKFAIYRLVDFVRSKRGL